MTTESNFFFKLSRFTEPLLAHYRQNPNFVYPPTRMNEIVSFVEQGLKDLSISHTSINWGISFPGSPDHVIYVWFDALTNYISALGFGSAEHPGFDHYWPANITWSARTSPASTPSTAGLSPGCRTAAAETGGRSWLVAPRQSEDLEVARNVVRPYNIIDEFGADPLRYFLLREMVFGQDQNYSDEAFLGRYNADLANDLGNTLSRAIKMTDTYFGGKTPPTSCPANECCAPRSNWCRSI